MAATCNWRLDAGQCEVVLRDDFQLSAEVFWRRFGPSVNSPSGLLGET